MNEFFIYLEDHHCKYRIFEIMENFQNDCCRSWTKKPFKKLVFKAVKNRKCCGLLIASRSDRMTKICLSPTDKVTLFETIMTTMNEAKRDKKNVPD